MAIVVRSSVLALVLLALVSQAHAQNTCNTTLLAAVIATPELSLLATVVDASGLASSLAATDNVTVIAPNNNAFNGTDGLLQLLRASNLSLENVTAPGDNRAASILLYHVVPTPARADQLLDGQVLPTQLNGGYTLTVRKGGEDGVTFVGKANNATVVVANVQVCNSIIHIVDRVLLPEATLTAIPVTNVTAAPGTPPAAMVPPPPGGSSAASALGAGSLVFGLSGAVAAALLM